MKFTVKTDDHVPKTTGAGAVDVTETFFFTNFWRLSHNAEFPTHTSLPLGFLKHNLVNTPLPHFVHILPFIPLLPLLESISGIALFLPPGSTFTFHLQPIHCSILSIELQRHLAFHFFNSLILSDIYKYFLLRFASSSLNRQFTVFAP
jgi:hypothetical protein